MMPHSYRIPALLLVLLVFLAAWYYAGTLKSVPARSINPVEPKAPDEPTSVARALRPPQRGPQVPADPFVPPAQPAPPAATQKEQPLQVLPAFPSPPVQTKTMPPSPALSPRPPAPATTQPRPTPPPAPVQPAGPPFKLSGVVMGDVPLAILAGADTVYTAIVGDELEGWRVIRITETEVTLRSPTGEEVVLTR